MSEIILGGSSGAPKNPQTGFREIYDDFQIIKDTVSLPSEGFFYKDGKSSVEVKYLTASEDDILYSPELIKNGKVFDALLNAIVLDKDLRPEQMLVGDRNAIIMHARINGIGEDYRHDEIQCESCEEAFEPEVNLKNLKKRKLEIKPDQNLEYEFVLPTMKIPIKFRLLTGEDETALNKFIQASGDKKKGTSSKTSPIVTERYLRQIMEVNGRRNDKLYVRKLIEAMPLKDSLAFREYVKLITPGIDLKYDVTCEHCGHSFEHELTLNPIRLFYPKTDV